MPTLAETRARSLETLKLRWANVGMPERFESASKQELLDLSDEKHRKRGEETQYKRIQRMDKAVSGVEKNLMDTRIIFRPP